ncbi:secreted phosphoprotein 24 isoform X1 [Sorex araneus]|uniref:secreted phosphoprotein 24 isoform X1 n=1 Tax=Sorex araneus TaxID=42254 RepID=UPI002433D479|nr:secreted phosphoprotein 24 isoform X1 [Sorex araneus]XP_054976521.1 secreted phosphoprotein 24 isoform X1 [Sorex araneus]XP_054976522.1 secreted phosphoprotein 24 isoform X1 [Sorex araneus]XP_054976523.1 secreted phosphoprotein 24 isoform X1 [Sorex araneus]XP_054976525.1 secreted phosphoprotein 24 isoform X1 [Sorex araneus]
MGLAALAIRLLLVLGVSGGAAGFPVYDFDPASLRDALGASVAKVNAQALSPYLFRAVRSSLRRVSVQGEDSVTLELEFRLRETVCRGDSGAQPDTCDLQRGAHEAAECRSTVRMSEEQVRGVWVRCHWASSSESSSEERVFGDLLGSVRRRSHYQPGLFLDPSLSGHVPERSHEISRRRFPPGNGRFQNQWLRARMSGGSE